MNLSKQTERTKRLMFSSSQQAASSKFLDGPPSRVSFTRCPSLTQTTGPRPNVVSLTFPKSSTKRGDPDLTSPQTRGTRSLSFRQTQTCTLNFKRRSRNSPPSKPSTPEPSLSTLRRVLPLCRSSQPPNGIQKTRSNTIC